jgi:hypothetical protein
MLFILITTTHYNALAKEHEVIFLVFSRFFFLMEIASLLNYIPTDYQSTGYLRTDYLPTGY